MKIKSSLHQQLQTLILKIYPSEMIIVAIYCLFVTTQSTLVAVIAEKDITAWKLQAEMGLVAVLYAVSKYQHHEYSSIFFSELKSIVLTSQIKSFVEHLIPSPFLLHRMLHFYRMFESSRKLKFKLAKWICCAIMKLHLYSVTQWKKSECRESLT